jgi:Domain of unknown function (DUF4403)
MIRDLIVILLCVSTLASLSSCDRGPVQLSEKPLRFANNSPLPSTPSTVAVSVNIPYARIGDEITKALPAQFADNGRQNVCVDLNEEVQKSVQSTIGGDVGKFLAKAARLVTTIVTVNQLRHVCQDIDYSVTVHRDDVASVAASGDRLRVSVPLSVEGWAGFSGDIAKAVALDKKSFRGSITAFVDLSIDLGPDWCPKIDAQPDFVWRDNAQLEVAGKFWISIDGTAGPKLKSAMQEAAKKLTSVISCDQMKSAISPFWHQYAIAIEPIEHHRQYINLVPTKAAFSGLRFEAGAIRCAFELVMSTEISTKAVSTEALLLPTLERISASETKLSLAVPMRADYGEMRTVALDFLKDKVFEADTPAGHASIKILDADIYPASPDLVAGLKFEAKLNNKMLDTKGWVYLIAQPWLDPGAQSLRLRNVRFTRDLDNDVWNVLSTIFQGEIKSSIEKQSVVDLKEKVALLRAYLQQQLKQQGDKQGIALSLNDTAVGLSAINLTDQDMEILVRFDGTAQAEIERVVANN